MQNEAERATDEAIARVEAGAGEAWLAEAISTIRSVAKNNGMFTTDDVWKVLTNKPAEPRALGAAMRRAAKKGYIRATSVYQKSKRPECHQRPIRCWQRTALA